MPRNFCTPSARSAGLLPVLGQLHSSLNGGSDGQGGMDELLMPPPAPPLDRDTPLDTDPLSRSHFLKAEDAGRWGLRRC
jgi:hypothetical protein